MGAFHFTAKIHSRSQGKSAVRSAAYRAGEKLHDRRLGKTENYSRKKDVLEAEIFAPDGSPAWVHDREELWNRVEGRENRKDAQVAQEFEINLPRELSDEENWRLIADFAKTRLVANGRICDIAFHKTRARDGDLHPHVHIMMPLRVLRDGVFVEKHHSTDWRNFFGRTDRISEMRADWCEFSRARAAELGIDLGPDWDHRSYQDRGIDIEAEPKIGGAAQRIAREEGTSERTEEIKNAARRNGERLLVDPGIALQALTNRQSTFTEQDLARWIHKHSADDQFQTIFEAARTQSVALGRDDRGRTRYSTQEMMLLEANMIETASALSRKLNHHIPPRDATKALRDCQLSGEQKNAALHLLTEGDLTCLTGYAGAGKSTMLGEVRTVLQDHGYRVHGAALSGIAAENLERGSGVEARTLASWSYHWEEGKKRLGKKDVLIVDEAGMIGSRQMLDVLSEARRGGAKVILVGDSEQLQAIEAGAAFRAIQERVGGAELTEIRRQHVAWQRDATRELAMGETNKAIGRYNNAGCINAEANPEAAQKLLVEHWHESGEKFPKDSRIMMAHTRADVAALNQAARIKMREDNKLSDDFEIITSRGQRAFAEGERLIFLRNDKALGVKNGTLGTLMEVEGSALAVRTDDGRKVIVQTGTYRDIDHGYAVTVHKAQGVTVDRSFVMATDGFDRHLAYVAFSRHREKLDVVYDRESFRSDDHMMRTLSRERSKDVTADYLGPSAAARDLTPSPGVAGNSLQQTKKGRKDDRSAGWEI